jgi:outer membrane receptor protein involved in Fe transport
MAKRIRLLIPTAVAMSLAILPCFAQSTISDCVQGQSTPPACEEPRIELRRITVTATRRESPIERVPVSVMALSGDQLRDMGAGHFSDFSRSVPGLSFTDMGFGGEKFVIRGVTMGVTAEARASTAIYLDEIPITAAGFGVASNSAQPLLVDIDRIEVLRGPQGTLFGAGAMGGAIRVITAQPDVSSFESYLEATGSVTEHGGPGYEVQGMVNAPLSNNRSAVRAVAYYRDLDGWIDNTLLGQKDVNNDEIAGLRLAGTWSGDQRLMVTGKIAHQRQQRNGSGVDQNNPPWTQQRFVEEPGSDEWALANLTLDYRFDWGRLISVTSYMDRAVDRILDISAFYNREVFPPEWQQESVSSVGGDDREEFVQEFRLISNGDRRLDWLLGLFYQDQDLHFALDIPVPGFDQKTGGLAALFGAPDKLLSGTSDRSLKQVAVFGDLIWAFSEKWEGTVGGRWFRFDHTNVSRVTGVLNGGATYEERKAEETGFTPQLGLSYFHDRNLTIYGRFASGYRPGGPNESASENFPGCPEELEQFGLDGVPDSYGSDSLLSYELGLKSGWVERNILLNAAAYYIDWTDIPTSVVLPCGASWLWNAGSAVSKGIEVELAAYPLNNLELTINGAYTNARLAEDVPNVGGFDGDPLPGVPEHAFGGSVSWFFPWFEGVTSSLRAEYQYVGSSWNAFGPSRIETPSHSLTNLRLALHRNRWETTLFVNNLFASRAIITAHDSPAGRYVTTARPFTVGISARWTY